MAMRTRRLLGHSNVIYDPLTGQPFPGNVIPQNRLDPAARETGDLYPVPQSSVATTSPMRR